MAKGKGAGRPTKCTPDRRKTILMHVRNGLPMKHAALMAGVGERTVYQWLSKAADQPRSVYAQFAQDLERAHAESVVALVARVAEAGQTDWRAATWLLTRRAPAEFMDPGKRAELAAAQARAEVARAEADRKVRYIEQRAALLEVDDER